VATMYPLVAFASICLWDQKRPKVLLARILRATDSFVAAPILIALLVLLGNAGLPSKCESLFAFDPQKYRSTRHQPLKARVDCDVTFSSNECGTGRSQVKEIQNICRATRAGFGLVIFTM
jgi:hypothetical protein